MRSPFGCVLVDFLGQRLPRSWATSPTISSLLPTLHDPVRLPVWPQPGMPAHPPVPALPPVPAHPPVHSPAQWAAAQTRGCQGEGRRQSPFLLMLARLPKYFHGTSNLNPWQPGYSELYKTREHKKAQAPSVLSRGDGSSGLNARLGVSVTISIGLPGSSKRRSCRAHPERLTSYCSLSRQTGLEHDCMNEHGTAVTRDQVGCQRMGGKARAAGGCGSQHSLFRHLWAS